MGPPPSDSSSLASSDHHVDGLTEGTRGSNYFFYDYDSSSWTLLANRSDEVDVRKLSREEQDMFNGSDQLEWESILKTKAVRVLTGKEASEARRRYPERVLSSRMVRRRKPLAELGAWKPKSRWCIHGHTDPDTGSLVTYAPTPQVEGMQLFMQASINLGHSFSFCDVKNAFCQSNRLQRPAGPIFAEPCEGLHLPGGALIAVDVPVYGLDDAPAAWRKTIADFLISEGYVRNIVEPCWYMLYDEKQRNVSQVLVEVDDLIVTADPGLKEQIKGRFHQRFVFGKWDENTAEYAGRRVQALKDCVTVDQEKYILEQLQAVPLVKGRRTERKAALTEEEFKAFRSILYKVNWVAKETRPEMSGMASILASRLQHATVEDVLILNRR